MPASPCVNTESLLSMSLAVRGNWGPHPAEKHPWPQRGRATIRKVPLTASLKESLRIYKNILKQTGVGRLVRAAYAYLAMVPWLESTDRVTD